MYISSFGRHDEVYYCIFLLNFHVTDIQQHSHRLVYEPIYMKICHLLELPYTIYIIPTVVNAFPLLVHLVNVMLV